jgi:hypothetical protein
MPDEFTLLADVIEGERGGFTLDISTQAKAALIEWVRRFKAPGPVTVKFRAGKESKTVQQLRKVHALFRDIADETGMDADEVKRQLKEKFLTRQREVVDIETSEVTLKSYVPSLAELEKDDMRDFIDKTMAWAGQFLGMSFDEWGAA